MDKLDTAPGLGRAIPTKHHLSAGRAVVADHATTANPARLAQPARASDSTGAASPARTADPFAFQASHRRLAWAFRLSVMTNVVLACAFVITVSVIPVLLPLKETRIALLRSDPADDRVYRVLPISQEVEGFDLLLEQMARRYVRLLLAVDAVSQTVRLQEAFSMTEGRFYKQFQKEFIESDVIKKQIADGLNRSIVVESADRISSRGGVWQYAVDFVQIDKRNNKVTETRKLRAYLALTTRPHQVREAEKFENPFGIRVIDLVLKERENS